MAMLARLLFEECVVLPWEWEKPLVRRLKASLVRTEGSIVLGDSSGIVVAWIGRLYWPFKVNLGGEFVLGETGGESP